MNFTREKRVDIRLGDKVIVSDPCYGLNTWCQGVLENVLPGNYKCMIEFLDDNSEKRVSAITVCHEEYADNLGYAPEYDAEPFEVGVDSGQAGIFDYAYYAKYHSDRHNPEHVNEEWYSRVGKCSYMGDTIDGYGLVSSSGYGDGGYTCWTAKNPDGMVYSIIIEFITEEDNDEDIE